MTDNLQQIESDVKKARELLEQAEQRLKEAQQAKEPDGIWKPKRGEYYHFLESHCDVRCYKNEQTLTDRAIFETQPVFKTRAEAEKEVEKRKVLQRLRELAGGWKPNWRDYGQLKWYLYYDNSYPKWKVGNNTTNQPQGIVYFETEAKAQSAIDELGDRLNVLLEV